MNHNERYDAQQIEPHPPSCQSQRTRSCRSERASPRCHNGNRSGIASHKSKRIFTPTKGENASKQSVSIATVGERQRSPGRGENHCFQKPRGPRLRVQRIVIRRFAFRLGLDRNDSEQQEQRCDRDHPAKSRTTCRRNNVSQLKVAIRNNPPQRVAEWADVANPLEHQCPDRKVDCGKIFGHPIHKRIH